MKKCKKCKTELREGTDFCPECGKKIKKGWWKRIVSVIVVLLLIIGGIAVLYSNDDKDVDEIDKTIVESKETSNSDKHKTNKVDQFERMMIDDEKLMNVAIAWYGNEKLNSNHWLAWKKEVFSTNPSDMDDSVHNTEKGDGIYHCYPISNKSNITQGYVLSKDKKTVYLYNRLSVGSEEKPEVTVSLNQVAKTIMDKHKSEMLIKLSKEKSTGNRDLELGNKQLALHDYMDEWQKMMNQEYEENPVDIDEGNNIEMNDVTITNKVVNHDDALLSINGKFVDLSLDKPSKQGYQVIAAYSGTSDNAKKYRYLFVMHNEKPEVLVAHMPEAIGDTKKGPAINFVPTKNDALPSAFKQIMMTGEAPKAPEKQENVVNSLDDAKAIYRQIFGHDATEGPVPNNPVKEGRWEEKSNGTYYYYCGDEYAADFMNVTIYPNGSVDYKDFIHGNTSTGTCTYEDVQNGTAKDKLLGE